MGMKFEMETVREIWNGEDKSCYKIGPDRDGLDCVELRYLNEEGIIKERMSFPPEQAKLIADALILCAGELIKKRSIINESRQKNNCV